jgi:hypothetical protein
MQEWLEQFRSTITDWDPSAFPSLQRIGQAMDPIAWTLVGLFGAAIVIGIVFTLSTRRSFTRPDEVEATPDVTLARLKQDPERLAPMAIVSRLGSEATLELLEYGDQITSKEWRYRWGRVREELLSLLAQQNAFGPTYALARYYRSNDAHEPDTIRIRRTALIHKLGLLRLIEPGPDGVSAELRVRCHPAEVQGDLGFDGPVMWLLPDEPAPAPGGPVVEMEPIEFGTLHEADMRLNIRRSPSVGGGFLLHLAKRRGQWVVAAEEIEWVS